MKRLAQVRIIGIRHADKAMIARLADQGIHAGEIDVILDQHDASGAQFRIERARGIGDDQDRNAALRPSAAMTGRMTAALPLS